MRVRLPILLLVAALLALSVPGMAAAKQPKHPKASGPTAKQISAAVAKARRSSDLWATMNVCTSSPTGDVAGVRGQMPSLGFTTTLVMNVSVSYWNYNDSKFEPVPPSQIVTLGQGKRSVRQGGVNFPFQPPTGGLTYLVRGTVTFEWKLGKKMIGTVTRNTGHGYANVGASIPAGYSSGTCTLT